MRNVSGRSSTGNQNTHFAFNDVFPKIVPFVRMWKNYVQPDRPHMAIWRMRIARWITNATDTHAEYVTLIAFPRQKLLRECATTFLHIHIAFLVVFNVGMSRIYRYSLFCS